MIYGVIDVGSNTIRLNIYKYENEEITSLLKKKKMAGLAGYVQDGYLSENGIETACKIIQEYKNILLNFNIKNIYIFATASLRNIINTDEVLFKIQEYTGCSIDVLSGQEEATLDFIGATHALNISSGLLIDIGGGSTELAVYEDGILKQAVSLPIGSLSLFSKHVSKLFPKKEEKIAIENEILEHLEQFDLQINSACSQNICGVGGTIRASKKLNTVLFNDDSIHEFPVENIKKMLKLLKKEEKKTLRRILQVVPDRIHTIIPGMLILHNIASYYNCQQIHVSNYGVREGYLFEKVLKKGVNNG
ncbi:MAG: phosphatase [Bacillus sp. (in: firmicutes)]